MVIPTMIDLGYYEPVEILLEDRLARRILCRNSSNTIMRLKDYGQHLY
jgi:hypothetical protein